MDGVKMAIPERVSRDHHTYLCDLERHIPRGNIAGIAMCQRKGPWSSITNVLKCGMGPHEKPVLLGFVEYC